MSNLKFIPVEGTNHDDSDGDNIKPTPIFGDMDYQNFPLFNYGSSFTNETISDRDNKNRSQRWLKIEDRKLVKAIMELQESGQIVPECLFDSIGRNSTTKQSWDEVQKYMQTERPITFLQSRYRKLVRNQHLNKYELQYLTDHYDKHSIEELQIIFPGKTKTTLSKLLQVYSNKHKVHKNLTEIIDEKVHKEDSSKVHVMEDTSSIVTTIEFSKEMFVDINSYINASSIEHLRSLAPKVLRKMQYNINQISGELLCQITALKASMKKDLAVQL